VEGAQRLSNVNEKASGLMTETLALLSFLVSSPENRLYACGALAGHSGLVRPRLKKDGHIPAPGSGISEQVRYTEKNEQVDRLFFSCTTRGGNEGNQNTNLAAEVVSVRMPNEGVRVVGVIAEGAPISEGGEWVKRYVSTPAALRQTESGVYTVGPAAGEN